MTGKILLLSTCAVAEAGRILRRLVETPVAACVNIVPGIRSIYRWKGEVTSDDESLLVISQLEAGLRKVHSYEVPELIAVPVLEGSAAPLPWLHHSLAPPRT